MMYISMFFFLFIPFMDSVLLFVFFLILMYSWFFLGNSGYSGVVYGDFLCSFMVFISLWGFFMSIITMGMEGMKLLTFSSMLVFILVSFLSESYILFYIFFEFSFVVIFFFLLSWGAAPERVQASFYMFFYTLIFSLPFLLMLVFYSIYVSYSFLFFSYFSYCGYLWIFMFLVFSVKLPLFGFHLWLPKAHVEAPVGGSMLLAGVLLKLGGYGLARFLYSLKFVMLDLSVLLGAFFMLSLFGSLYASILCLRQSDLKKLIAYSSVVHMGVAFSGLMSFSHWGVLGCIFMLVSHGFVSPLLFFLMNLIYSSHSSRSIMLLKGALVSSPLFCLFWFTSCVLNMSFPPFMSFFSEILIIGSMSFLGVLEWVIILFLCFFTGVYCVLMYVMPSHGGRTISSVLLTQKHFFIGVLHLFFVLLYPLVGFFPL